MVPLSRLGWSCAVVALIVSLRGAPGFAGEPIDRLTAGQVVELGQLVGHLGAVYSIAWSPDGSRIATGSSDGTTRIWDSKTQAPLLTLEQGTASRWGVAWSPDGTRVATVGRGSMVRVWDSARGQKLAELARPVSCTYCVAWSPDGTRVAVGEADGTIVLLDPTDLHAIKQWPGHTEGGLSTEVIAIAWSPDGTKLASGGIDFALRVWDAATGAPLAVLRASTTVRNDINGVAWSPDGLLIAAAGQDGCVRIWDPVAKTEERNLKAGPSWTRGVAWSPDGKVLATSGAVGRLLLWDPQTGNLLATLSDKGPDIWSVAFSPDGTRLASGAGSYEVRQGVGTIRLWGTL